jgi:RNA-directed DNA polymerase
MRQKTELEITLRAGARGEARSAGAEGTEARAATTEVESRAAGWPSMEAIVERDNLRKALAQVKRNKGAAGSWHEPRCTGPLPEGALAHDPGAFA